MKVEVNRSLPEAQPTGATIVWPRSGSVVDTPPDRHGAQVEGSELSDSPAGEIERILREYASECYAVGRGESMFYLVDDLPRLAHAATQEVLAVRPRRVADRWRAGLGIQTRAVPLVSPARSGPVSVLNPVPHPEEDAPSSVTQALKATARRGARSVVAVLPVLTVLAALGLTIVLAFATL